MIERVRRLDLCARILRSAVLLAEGVSLIRPLVFMICPIRGFLSLRLSDLSFVAFVLCRGLFHFSYGLVLGG